MFRKLFLVLAAVFLAGCGTMGAKELSPLAKSLEDRYGLAVVWVMAKYPDGTMAIKNGAIKPLDRKTSTGVSVGESRRHVWTVYHGIADDPLVKIYLFPGDGHRYEARVVWSDNKRDMALLLAEGPRPLPASVLLAMKEPATGEGVVSMGYPKDKWTVSDAVWGGNDSAYDNKTDNGSSGSPIFNSSGNVVALKKTAGFAEFFFGDGIRVPRTVAVKFKTNYSDVVTVAEFCEAYGKCADFQATQATTVSAKTEEK